MTKTFDDCVALCNKFGKYLPTYLFYQVNKDIRISKFEADIDINLNIDNKTILIKDFHNLKEGSISTTQTPEEFYPKLDSYFKRKQSLIKEALFVEFQNEIKEERYKKLLEEI